MHLLSLINSFPFAYFIFQNLILWSIYNCLEFFFENPAVSAVLHENGERSCPSKWVPERVILSVPTSFVSVATLSALVSYKSETRSLCFVVGSLVFFVWPRSSVFNQCVSVWLWHTLCVRDTHYCYFAFTRISCAHASAHVWSRGWGSPLVCVWITLLNTRIHTFDERETERGISSYSSCSSSPRRCNSEFTLRESSTLFCTKV